MSSFGFWVGRLQIAMLWLSKRDNNCQFAGWLVAAVTSSRKQVGVVSDGCKGSVLARLKLHSSLGSWYLRYLAPVIKRCNGNWPPVVTLLQASWVDFVSS